MFLYKLIQAVCFGIASSGLDSHRLTSTLFLRPQALVIDEIATTDRLKGGGSRDRVRSSSEERRKKTRIEPHDLTRLRQPGAGPFLELTQVTSDDLVGGLLFKLTPVSPNRGYDRKS